VSAIRFHFGEGPVLQVRGPERALMSTRVTGIAVSMADLTGFMGDGWYDQRAFDLFGPFIGIEDDQSPEVRGLAHRLAMSFSGIGSFRQTPFSWKGQEIDAWCLALNTSLAVGSDPIRLSAKIHATCEIHGFFAGSDRRWLADIIEEGLEEGVFRKEMRYPKDRLNPEGETELVSMGWTELVEQLRESLQFPVVMSFTVTDGFPDPPKSWRPHLKGGDRWEQWSSLDDRKRFDLALVEVVEARGNKPISPETLRKYRFGHELSLLDLMARDFDKIERSLECQS
jgi:hypothetical protein